MSILVSILRDNSQGERVRVRIPNGRSVDDPACYGVQHVRGHQTLESQAQQRKGPVRLGVSGFQKGKGMEGLEGKSGDGLKRSTAGSGAGSAGNTSGIPQ